MLRKCLRSKLRPGKTPPLQGTDMPWVRSRVVGGVVPGGLKYQPQRRFLTSGRDFTLDNSAATLQNKAWACQVSADSPKAAPAVQGPRHSKGLKGSESPRKGPGAEPKAGNKPRCTGMGQGRTVCHGPGSLTKSKGGGSSSGSPKQAPPSD